METGIMENYPFKIVCFSATLTIVNYLLGTLIFYALNQILGIFFLLLCVLTILTSLKLRCSYCYYYGKICNFGLGKLSKLFFKQGDPNEFKNPKKVVPTAILSFGTLLLPIIGGIVLIIADFSLLNISLLAVYVLIGVFPNFFLRGRFCEKCEQGRLGCPAYEQMIKRR